MLPKDLAICFIEETLIVSGATPEHRKKASCLFRLLNPNCLKSKEKETDV